MSRWIDADAWWKAVQKHYTDGDCTDDDRYELGINVGITKSRNVMMSAPSIEIIRCGECKWGKPYSDKQLKCDALGLGGLKFPDDYCSYGERESE